MEALLAEHGIDLLHPGSIDVLKKLLLGETLA